MFEWHGKKYHYLGTDSDGENYYLEEAKWDCDWYWGLGYVETFTNKMAPWNSKDISSHSHFSYMLDEVGGNWYDAFRSVFPETRLADNQIWKLVELMKSAYTARKYSDMLYIGGAHYTENPVKDTIISETEYNRINKEVIPSIMDTVYKLLEGV